MLILGMATAGSALHLEGRYTDEQHSMIYEIETDGPAVLVKRGRFGQWQRFIPHRRNTYINRVGDILRTSHRSIILDKKRYRVHLYRLKNVIRPRNHYLSRNAGVHSIHGTWHSGHGRKKIRIVSYRNGLKVTISNRYDRTTEFYHLVRDWDRVRVFRTDCGKTISVNRQGTLLWNDASGHHQIQFHR